MADFTSEVRRLMAERGMSLRGLGRAAGYDPSHLSKILNGRKPASPYLAARLDDALGADGKIRQAAATAPPGGSARRAGAPDPDEINRRELLYLFSVAGALMAAPAPPDWDRLDYFASRGGGVDAETVDGLAALNAHLWRVFVLSKSKALVFPIVREQLGVMTGYLRSPASAATYQRLCALAGDLFQLAGEILFDGNSYTDAAQCYTLAATASKEAGAHDLWACALTRHAFIAVYERAFGNAVPLLELASGLARRGDSALSTRHWVAVVQAHAFAGLGDMSACQAALDAAGQVSGSEARCTTGAGSGSTARAWPRSAARASPSWSARTWPSRRWRRPWPGSCPRAAVPWCSPTWRCSARSGATRTSSPPTVPPRSTSPGRPARGSSHASWRDCRPT
jgi:transcriptional regulator with XRE-family HTH domain